MNTSESLNVAGFRTISYNGNVLSGASGVVGKKPLEPCTSNNLDCLSITSFADWAKLYVTSDVIVVPSFGTSNRVAPAELKFPAESATDLKSMTSLKFTLPPPANLKLGILS